MDQRFTLKNASQDRSRTIGRRIVLTEVGESLGHTPARRTVPTLAVKGLQMAKRGTAPVTKSLSAFIARTQFGQILERVSQKGDRFVVTKKGEAKAVILGVEDFFRAVVKTPKSLAALQEQARRRGTTRLTLEEIEAEIAAVRRTKTRTNA